jgi:hypothetical protein
MYDGVISNGEGILLKSIERGRVFTQLRCVVLMEGQGDSWINEAIATTGGRIKYCTGSQSLHGKRIL